MKTTLTVAAIFVAIVATFTLSMSGWSGGETMVTLSADGTPQSPPAEDAEHARPDVRAVSVGGDPR